MGTFFAGDLAYIAKLNALQDAAMVFSQKAASFNAANGNYYYITANAVVATANATPTAGDRMRFEAPLAGVTGFSIARNGSNINGAAADYVPPSINFNTEAIYVDATVGWRIYELNAAAPVIDAMSLSQNLTIVATRAANAETWALKTKAGADPSSGDPIKIAFRDAADTTGGYNVLTISAAVSLTIPSGGTLGAVNGVAFRLWLVGFNDAGTFRLGIVNTRLADGIMSLKDDLTQSSTAIGAGSGSVGVFYTGVGVATKALRVLGYLDYTLAAVGTWSTAPAKIQVFSQGCKLPGDVVQVRYTQTGALVTGPGTATPVDDTIPQNTEGDQFMTQAITPTADANKLFIEHIATYACTAGPIVSALFQDSIANALAAMTNFIDTTDKNIEMFLRHEMVAGTHAATTFKIRTGSSGALVVTMNGRAAARLFGGILTSSLRVTEIMG